MLVRDTNLLLKQQITSLWKSVWPMKCESVSFWELMLHEARTITIAKVLTYQTKIDQEFWFRIPLNKHKTGVMWPVWIL